LGEFVGPVTRAILIVNVSGDGLDILIFKNASLQFDYFRSWRSIQGEGKEITRGLFESTLHAETQKVINFTLSHFRESPEQIFLVAPGFEDEVKKILETHFSITTVPFRPSLYPVPPTWYVPLGSAMRGAIEPKTDVFISLGPETSSDIYYEEQVIGFIKLWRNIIATVLALNLAVFVASAAFLVNKSKDLQVTLDSFKAKSTESELADLTAKADLFNSLVGAVSAVKNGEGPWYDFFVKINSLTRAGSIKITSVAVNSFDTAINLAGTTSDYETVIKFKNTLLADPEFSEVNLPLSAINQVGQSIVNFGVTFKFKPAS
jgi:hypothetical protein